MESSCLLSNRFWRIISPEPFQLQEIYFPFLASVFEELSVEKEILQIGQQNQLFLHNMLIFQ